MADDGGQQVLSPYHAMSCNPVTTVDPLGLKGLEMMSVGMQTVTPQEAAYWNGGNHTFNQFQDAVDYRMLEHELTYDALQGKEGASGYATSTSDGSAGNGENDVFESNKGVDYIFNGNKFMGDGVPNNLPYNRIKYKEYKKDGSSVLKKTKNIGTTEIKINRSKYMEQGRWIDGQHFEIEGNTDIARSIYIFVMQNSSNEWSYIEYQYKNNAVYSRIATSQLTGNESIGVTIAKRNELVNPLNLNYWIHIHSHPRFDTTPSDYDHAGWSSVISKYSNAKNYIILPSQEYQFYQLLP